ncbi:Nucleolar protein 16 [Sparganum proliferum]
MSVKANFQNLGLAFNPNQAVGEGSEEQSQFSTETSTVRELKKLKRCSKQREKFISEDDRLFSMYMMELYGEDHKILQVAGMGESNTAPRQHLISPRLPTMRPAQEMGGLYESQLWNHHRPCDLQFAN